MENLNKKSLKTNVATSSGLSGPEVDLASGQAACPNVELRVNRAQGEKPEMMMSVEKTAPARDLESESGMSSDYSRLRRSRRVRKSSRPAEKRPRETRTSDGGSATEPGQRATVKKTRHGAATSATEEDGSVAQIKKANSAALRQERSETEAEAQQSEMEKEKEAPVTLREFHLRMAARLLNVTQQARNLKGTLQRDIILSVSELKKVAAESPAEVKQLQAQNAQLCERVAALEAALASQNKAPQEQRNTKKAAEGANGFDVLERRIIALMDARLEAFARRLIPAPLPRPSAASVVAGPSWPALGVGKPRNKSAACVLPSLVPAARPAGVSATVPLSSSRKRRRRARNRTRTPAPCPPTAPTFSDAGWTIVGKKGKKSAVRTQTKTVARKVVPQLRLPTKAAVTLTVTPEALERGMSYAQALRQVQQEVDLASLAIGGLRARRVATGAYLFEVPGPESEAKADSLINKMREVFRGSDDVRVARPVKTAELRVSGLDESVTPEAVATAIAKTGECSAQDIKVGEVRTEHSGLGAVWVRAPVKVADKLTRAGRILVGWVSAGVRLLEPRPQRCFRCLYQGHVRAKCTAECDRSGICYRCGQEGHKARECSADPRCALCASAGKPAEHRVGGKACVASSIPHRSRRGRGAEVVTRPQPSRPEVMEIAH